MGVSWLNTVAFIFAFIFQCNPPKVLWDIEVVTNSRFNEYCVNRWALWWSFAVIDIFICWWTLLLPVKMLMSRSFPNSSIVRNTPLTIASNHRVKSRMEREGDGDRRVYCRGTVMRRLHSQTSCGQVTSNFSRPNL